MHYLFYLNSCFSLVQVTLTTMKTSQVAGIFLVMFVVIKVVEGADVTSLISDCGEIRLDFKSFLKKLTTFFVSKIRIYYGDHNKSSHEWV